jgi:hypothetical protein
VRGFIFALFQATDGGAKLLGHDINWLARPAATPAFDPAFDRFGQAGQGKALGVRPAWAAHGDGPELERRLMAGLRRLGCAQGVIWEANLNLGGAGGQRGSTGIGGFGRVGALTGHGNGDRLGQLGRGKFRAELARRAFQAAIVVGAHQPLGLAPRLSPSPVAWEYEPLDWAA